MCNLASWAVKEGGRKKKKKRLHRQKIENKRKQRKKSYRALLPLIVVAPNGLGNSLLN